LKCPGGCAGPEPALRGKIASQKKTVQVIADKSAEKGGWGGIEKGGLKEKKTLILVGKASIK